MSEFPEQTLAERLCEYLNAVGEVLAMIRDPEERERVAREFLSRDDFE